MWRGKKQFSSIKIDKIFDTVIDHNVNIYDFMAAKDNILPSDKWKMFLEPFILIQQ